VESRWMDIIIVKRYDGKLVIYFGDSGCQRMTAFNMCRVMKSHQFCNIWVCKIFNVVPCKKQITIM